MLGLTMWCTMVLRWKSLLLCVGVSHILPTGVVEAVAPEMKGLKAYWTDALAQASQTRDVKWAEAAYSGLHFLDCEHFTFTSHKECKRLVSLPKSAVTVYLAPISPYGRYLVSVPDEDLSNGELHDAVLVLDVYPEVSFGHPVLVFFVDTGFSRARCHRKGGFYLEQDECMYHAARRRCRNLSERRSRRRNFAKKCEINFLPNVRIGIDGGHRKNHLVCRSDLNGFHECPRLKALNVTFQLPCFQLGEKAPTCSSTLEAGTSCRVFEVCDQAVLLSGGWNYLTTTISHTNNLARMYQLLRDNGFKKRNIKIFFASGMEDFETTDTQRETPTPTQAVYSAALKLALRSHVGKMCSSPHCVDSLVMYLNSPALHDGSSLLWDVNEDGMADEHEKYTVKELLVDLAECTAKQVLIIVDQSYSGELVHAVKSSNHHGNLIVVSSGKVNEYSHGSEFSLQWTHHNHTRACAVDVFKDMASSVKNSTPAITNTGHLRSTMAGAPCNEKPPLSESEIRRSFHGCQNLPTAVWLREMFRESTPETDQTSHG